jgi:hypothetical protein
LSLDFSPDTDHAKRTVCDITRTGSDVNNPKIASAHSNPPYRQNFSNSNGIYHNKSNTRSRACDMSGSSSRSPTRKPNSSAQYFRIVVSPSIATGGGDDRPSSSRITVQSLSASILARSRARAFARATIVTESSSSSSSFSFAAFVVVVSDPLFARLRAPIPSFTAPGVTIPIPSSSDVARAGVFSIDDDRRRLPTRDSTRFRDSTRARRHPGVREVDRSIDVDRSFARAIDRSIGFANRSNDRSIDRSFDRSRGASPPPPRPHTHARASRSTRRRRGRTARASRRTATRARESIRTPSLDARVAGSVDSHRALERRSIRTRRRRARRARHPRASARRSTTRSSARRAIDARTRREDADV